MYTKGLEVCFVLICSKQVLHFADVISVHIRVFIVLCRALSSLPVTLLFGQSPVLALGKGGGVFPEQSGLAWGSNVFALT